MVLCLATPAFAAADQGVYQSPKSTAMTACEEKGLVKGIDASSRNSNSGLTRGQLAQILYNAYGDKLAGTTAYSFADVSNDTKYAEAIRWVGTNGIVLGSKRVDGKTYFNPNAQVDRKYMALILFRTGNKLGASFPAVLAAPNFSDISSLGETYQKAINSTYRAGLFSKNENGEFGPGAALYWEEAYGCLNLLTDLKDFEIQSPAKQAQNQPETAVASKNNTDDAITSSGSTPNSENRAKIQEYTANITSYAENLGYTVSSPYGEMTTGDTGVGWAIDASNGSATITFYLTVASTGGFLFSYRVSDSSSGYYVRGLENAYALLDQYA